MFDQVIERGLYAAMAAVLIVPEPATFLVFFGFLVGLMTLLCRFAWALLADSHAE